MKITVKQLKSLIKEAIVSQGNLKKALFADLDDALSEIPNLDDSIFNVSNITVLSEFISPELMDQLMSAYSTSEIMMMYGEWEFTRNK